ncbi:MAG: heme NO-binding domain-containing protein [Sulfitobacter sp.]
MLGLINRTIQSYVRHSYGHATWDEVTDHAGVGVSEFESMLPYRDDFTPRLLDAAAEVLDRPRADVMEDIGTFIVSHPEFESVRRLLRFSGDDFLDFVLSLEDLDDRVRLAVSDLDLPKVEIEMIADGHFELRCNADVAGYGHVMMGVLRAMADDYGALAFLEHTGRKSGAETVSISLIESDYAEGRSFELGARAG